MKQQQQQQQQQPRLRVLLYWPNVVGYARLVLILWAVCRAWFEPVTFIVLYAAQAILDGAISFPYCCTYKHVQSQISHTITLQ